MSDDTDDDSPPFPAVVAVAGWVWAGVGAASSVIAVAIAAVMICAAVMTGVRLEDDTLIALAVTFFGLVGYTCVKRGVATACGSADSVRRDGFGSIGIGLVVTALAGGVGYYLPHNFRTILTLVGVALPFLAAGVCAVGGSRPYRAWREHHSGPSATRQATAPNTE